MTGELEHVVGVARLAGIRGQPLRKLLHGKEVLALSMPAHRIRATIYDMVPKARGGGLKARFASQFMLPRQSDHLGNLRVAVQQVKSVFAAEHWFEHPLVVEIFASNFQIALVAGVRRQVGKHFVHPTVLSPQHFLDLRFVELCKRAIEPVGDPTFDFERLLIAGKAIRVAQPGEDFVMCVEGNPDSIQRELRGVDSAITQLFKRLLADRQHIPVAICFLGSLRVQPRCSQSARALVHPRCCRTENSPQKGSARARVAADVSLLPAAVSLCLWRKTRLQAKGRQQSVRFNHEQIARMNVLAFLENPAIDESDLGKGKEFNFQRCHCFETIVLDQMRDSAGEEQGLRGLNRDTRSSKASLIVRVGS